MSKLTDTLNTLTRELAEAQARVKELEKGLDAVLTNAKGIFDESS